MYSSSGSDSVCKHIAESTIVEMQKGDIVYLQSDPAIHCFEVLSGTVRTCRFYFDGHRQLTGFYFENDVFGLEHTRYAATAETVTDVVLRKLCSHQHKQPIDQTPDTVEKTEFLERALEGSQHNLFLLGHRLATERVAAFLLAISKRSKVHDRFELPMLRIDIADHLGLTIHTVSRCFAELRRQHVICLKGRQFVTILDPVKLHRLAGEPNTEKSPPISTALLGKTQQYPPLVKSLPAATITAARQKIDAIANFDLRTPIWTIACSAAIVLLVAPGIAFAETGALDTDPAIDTRPTVKAASEVQNPKTDKLMAEPPSRQTGNTQNSAKDIRPDAILDKLQQIEVELAEQRKQLTAEAARTASQQDQITKLTEQLSNERALAAMRGAGAPQDAANGTGNSISPGIGMAMQSAPVQTQPDQAVGEAPPKERQLQAREQAIPEGQGVLTPRGRSVLESSFTYTGSSANRLVFRGIELVPGLQLGLIEASTAKRDTIEGAITLRHGLTNRLEIEARVPVLYRRDNIQVVQQRNEGIVREINLHEYYLGDAEVAVRYQLNEPKGPQDPIFVGSLRLKSHTGIGPFDVGYDEFGVATGLATGSGFWGLQPGVNFLLPSDPAVIYGGISYLWNIPRNVNKTIAGALIGHVHPGGAITANLGFGFALNPRFSFSLGYNHSYIFPTETEIGGTHQRSKALQVGIFNFGTSYVLNERQSVNFGFAFGVTADAPNVTVTLRLPLTF